MFSFQQELEFAHPAEAVWPHLIAFEQVPLWESGVVEVRQVTPGPPEVGSEIVARRRYGGRESTLTGTITAYDVGCSATMALRGGPLELVEAEYAVTPLGRDRSIVVYRARGSFAGPMRLLRPLIGVVGRREARRNLAALRARIDAAAGLDALGRPDGPGQ